MDITASDSLQVNSFVIGSYGWGQLDEFQPKTTLFLEIASKKSKAKMKTQTTISQRDLDVEVP